MSKKDEMSPRAYEAWMAARLKHGEYLGGEESPEHYIWRSMLQRCGKTKYYKHVKVCKRWHKFENFLADMGRRPSPKHSIDRHPNNAGNYEPRNCRWATHSEQQKNKRSTRRWENGIFIGTQLECAVYLGISKELASWRMKTWGTFKKGEEWQLQRAL